MNASQESSPLHVFKFGGTSVATAERIRRVVDLVRATREDASKRRPARKQVYSS